MKVLMSTTKFIKLVTKNLLSSSRWPYSTFRQIISRILFGLGVVARPFNLTASRFLNIYGCVFAFNPDRLAAQLNPNFARLDNHLIFASRAFFEMAFANGELLKICNFLNKTTTFYPYLFAPWKLLHYCYYFTKSWELLSNINATYEQFRSRQLDSAGLFGYDVIVGDHITSSIGHSQIFFDFEILQQQSLAPRPKIAVYRSNRDSMSSFYRQLMPEVMTNNVSLQPGKNQRFDLVNFIQDSFPFLVTKKYFDYSDEKGRAKYLATWAAKGARAFTLTPAQKDQLDLFLLDLGLTQEDWYVVLHVREAPDNSIRNANIDTYYGAIKAITSQGGWVFRIGDAGMTPLHKGLHRVIDLPFIKMARDKYIDLYLLASARFVICTPSGPSDFPFYFNVPRLLTNWHTMSALFGSSNDICLPVSYYCTSLNTIVPLKEQLNSAAFDNEPSLQTLTSIKPIKNSPTQIEQASIEMIELTAQQITKNHFPFPKANSLIHPFEGKLWFMGSVAKSFLADNIHYLD